MVRHPARIRVKEKWKYRRGANDFDMLRARTILQQEQLLREQICACERHNFPIVLGLESWNIEQKAGRLCLEIRISVQERKLRVEHRAAVQRLLPSAGRRNNFSTQWSGLHRLDTERILSRFDNDGKWNETFHTRVFPRYQPRKRQILRVLYLSNNHVAFDYFPVRHFRRLQHNSRIKDNARSYFALLRRFFIRQLHRSLHCATYIGHQLRRRSSQPLQTFG